MISSLKIKKHLKKIFDRDLYGKRNDEERFKMTQLNREINRSRNDIEQLEKALVSAESIEKKTFDWFKTLFEIRSKEVAFHPLADENPILIENEQVVGIVRTSLNRDERLISLINVSRDVQKIEMCLLKFSNKFKVLLATPQSDFFKNEKHVKIITEVQLEPYQCIWLKEEVL